MAMGVPMVISYVGGAAEVVPHGEAGFVFPVGDTGALVTCLEPLSDSRKRQGFGSAASELAVANFGADRMLDGYGALSSGLVYNA
jgi:L-malate glycosyltransferase